MSDTKIKSWSFLLLFILLLFLHNENSQTYISESFICHCHVTWLMNSSSFFTFNINMVKKISAEEQKVKQLKALTKGKNLGMNQSMNIQPGIIISKKSFEGLVKEKSETSKLYYLHKKGNDMLSVNIDGFFHEQIKLL